MVAPAGSAPLCFFHLQKCGGTSLKAAIRQGFAPTHEDEVVVDLDAAAASRTAAQAGVHNFEVRDSLLAYHLRARGTRAVMGHFRFNAEQHDALRDSSRMISVLREPAPRLISAYYYDRFKDDTHGKISLGLREFLLDANGEPTLRARVHAEKAIVFFRGDGSFENRAATQLDVDNAIRHLTGLAAVGFLEELDPFLDTLSEWADEPLTMPTLNKSPASTEDRSELTDELRAVVQEICEPAQIVYDRVRDHFLG